MSCDRKRGTRFIPGWLWFCLRKKPGSSVVPCGRIGWQLRAQDKVRGRRTRRKAGVRGRLVGPRVKKETAAPVGGRRRRFSAAVAEQSPMGLDVSSLSFSRRDEDLAFVWVKVSREFLIHGYAYRRTSGDTKAWLGGWLLAFGSTRK